MEKLGVETHRLRPADKKFQKLEVLYFEGYAVQPPNNNASKKGSFTPFSEIGTLEVEVGGVDEEEMIAKTQRELPTGLSGGPVFDADDYVCGCNDAVLIDDVGEYETKGHACFVPSSVIAPFVEHVERYLAKQYLSRKEFESILREKRKMHDDDDETAAQWKRDRFQT
jgi:hypothetical protein